MSEQPKVLIEKIDALDKDMILRYWAGTLSEKERRTFEEFFTEDDFTGDAIEGLLEMKDPIQLNGTRRRIHKMISKKIQEKRKIKHKSISFPTWLILSIIILLLIMLAGYLLIKKLSL